MDERVQESWERFLHPAALRTNMITASLIITAYELLKDAVISRIRDFFSIGSKESSPKYRADVLSKNKSPLYASLQWLKEVEAINDDDLVTFDLVKRFRNDLAHEPARFLTDGLPNEWPDRFNEIVKLVGKIEKWWIFNVEIPSNPEYHGEEIKEEDILPGAIMTLKLMFEIALGSEEESMRYFNHFVEKKSKL